VVQDAAGVDCVEPAVERAELQDVGLGVIDLRETQLARLALRIGETRQAEIDRENAHIGEFAGDLDRVPARAAAGDEHVAIALPEAERGRREAAAQMGAQRFARLLRGRLFTEQDGPDSPLVAVVDESMAQRYWPGEDPIGQRIKGFDQRGKNDDWVTVIGVVQDMRRHGREQKLASHVYEWYKQSGNATPDLVVRTQSDPKALAPTLRNVVRGLDRTAILSPVTTLEQQLSDQLAPRRFQTWLLALFSLMAVVLASVGIYGVMHYLVARRTHEIGIRMALGAQPGNVVRMVIGQGIMLAAIGLAGGLIGAWWLTRLLASLLFGVTATDPLTFGAVAILLTIVAILASSIPALRAARVDPLAALRCE